MVHISGIYFLCTSSGDWTQGWDQVGAGGTAEWFGPSLKQRRKQRCWSGGSSDSELSALGWKRTLPTMQPANGGNDQAIGQGVGASRDPTAERDGPSGQRNTGDNGADGGEDLGASNQVWLL